jgi:hypothetical protein
MISIVIPVLLSLFLGPGIGQLYNREFKKGLGLIFLSLGILLAFVIWVSRAVINYIPSGVNMADATSLRAFLQLHMKEIQGNIIKDHPVTFFVYEALLVLLWVYGVVDAYRGALRARQRKLST